MVSYFCSVGEAVWRRVSEAFFSTVGYVARDTVSFVADGRGVDGLLFLSTVACLPVADETPALGDAVARVPDTVGSERVWCDVAFE